MYIKGQEIGRGLRKVPLISVIFVIMDCAKVYYGYTDWPSACEWIVPGTIED